MRNDLVERGILSIEWSCCNPASQATKLAKFAKRTEDYESAEFVPAFSGTGDLLNCRSSPAF
jgi:hypothetical protein